MEKYNISMIEYYDKNGKQFKIHCEGVELLDNTQEFAGYWSAEIVMYKDFRLKENDRSEFIFYTDQNIRLGGRGTVHFNGQGGYSLKGEGYLERK